MMKYAVNQGLRRRSEVTIVTQVAIAVTLLLGAHSASAQDCSTLPSPVYIPATTDVKPFLSRIAPKLATAAGAEQQTIIYQGVGSCTAVDAVNTGSLLQGTAVYWTGALNADGTGVEATCTIPVAGVKASLALSDVTVRTCTGADVPAGLNQFSSMVQPFGFIVPPNSTQQAITAAEAYFILKYGGQAAKQAPPWIDPLFVVVRTPAASTQLLTGLAAGVPGTMWSASLTNSNTSSSNVITKVAAENTTGNAEKTIGILSTQKYDSSRDKVKMLAFQAFKQQCLGAVYPDSTTTGFDKLNVRDGHYSIWGYLWSVAKVDGSNVPSDPAAKKFIDFVTGKAIVNGADPNGDAAKAGAVPACAMRVKRAFDGAPLEANKPADPCTCFFDLKATGVTNCAPCTSDASCTGGATCHFGYCEK